MRPIPVAVHVGPFVFHTYGLGLAITFMFAAWYLGHRLRDNGYDASWVSSTAIWTVVAALVGARVIHVAANSSGYVADPVQVLEVWKGGLSSFGGILFGVPTGFILAHRRCREVPLRTLADLVAPVLLAGWAVGRLLGPQLMVAGGGHPTHQWFGMYYAGQVGRRLPVPIFQSLMTFAVLFIAWQVEKWVTRRGGPHGLVMAVSVGFWGTNRFIEEHLWLAYPGHVGAIATESAGLAFAVAGFASAATLLIRNRGQRGPEGAAPAQGDTGDEADAPLAQA